MQYPRLEIIFSGKLIPVMGERPEHDMELGLTSNQQVGLQLGLLVSAFGLWSGLVEWRAVRAFGSVQFTLSVWLSFVFLHGGMVSLGAACGNPLLGALCAAPCAVWSAAMTLRHCRAKKEHLVTGPDLAHGIAVGWVIAVLLLFAMSMCIVDVRR